MGYRELLRTIDPDKLLVVQTHDFPDHDAAASAFGLYKLFRAAGLMPPLLCFGGRLQSESLEETIRVLGIPLVPCSELELPHDAQVILVDGLTGNRNVTDLQANLIGVIDHHKPLSLPSLPYLDVRPDYGSCSTILYEYFVEAGVRPDRDTATALLMGIMMDTSFLTRAVLEADLEAFAGLFSVGDWEFGSTLLKNSISLRDLPVFQEAISSSYMEDDSCFVFIDRECSGELIAIVADFFLRLREIKFVVVVNGGHGEYKISVRSEDRMRPANVVLQKALDGIGTGGGHIFMGGGAIEQSVFPGRKAVIDRFLGAMDAVRA